MNRGYSLIELIVTIVIILILGAGAVSAYLFVFKKGIETPTIIKDEMELQLSLAQLLKDAESTGFGLTRDYFKAGNSCNFNSLLTNRESISICTSPWQLFLISLAVRNDKKSGCWGYTDAVQGCAILQNRIKSSLGFDCTTGNLTNTTAIATDFYKYSTVSCINDPSCSSGLKCEPNVLVYYTGNNSYPSAFATRYYLSTTNVPDLCAPGTGVLVKQVNGGVGEPVISCVHTFRVYYLINNPLGSPSISYQTSPPGDFTNLKGIRLCLLVQVGRKRDSVITPQNLSNNCGGPVNITSEQRHYRWKAIEIDIPLRNIKVEKPSVRL